MNDKVNRNDPCPCGSGKKYKKCCYGKKQALRRPVKLIKSGNEAKAQELNPQTGGMEAVKKMMMDPKFWQLPKFGPEEEKSSGPVAQGPVAQQPVDGGVEEKDEKSEEE